MRKKKKIVYLIPLQEKRFKVIYLVCLSIIISLFGRLVNLQVFSASDLQKKARLIQSSKTISFRTRRSILDRNNRLISYDKPLYKLWAHPKYFRFPGDSKQKLRSIEEVIKKISPVLEIQDEIILAKFKKNKIGFELLDKLSEEKAKRLKNSNKWT